MIPAVDPDVKHLAGDMLPIGCNYTMDGTGKMKKITAFSPVQARSAFALYAGT